jgi:hypothetical protein
MCIHLELDNWQPELMQLRPRTRKSGGKGSLGSASSPSPGGPLPQAKPEPVDSTADSVLVVTRMLPPGTHNYFFSAAAHGSPLIAADQPVSDAKVSLLAPPGAKDHSRNERLAAVWCTTAGRVPACVPPDDAVGPQQTAEEHGPAAPCGAGGTAGTGLGGSGGEAGPAAPAVSPGAVDKAQGASGPRPPAGQLKAGSNLAPAAQEGKRGPETGEAKAAAAENTASETSGKGGEGKGGDGKGGGKAKAKPPKKLGKKAQKRLRKQQQAEAHRAAQEAARAAAAQAAADAWNLRNRQKQMVVFAFTNVIKVDRGISAERARRTQVSWGREVAFMPNRVGLKGKAAVEAAQADLVMGEGGGEGWGSPTQKMMASIVGGHDEGLKVPAHHGPGRGSEAYHGPSCGSPTNHGRGCGGGGCGCGGGCGGGGCCSGGGGCRASPFEPVSDRGCHGGGCCGGGGGDSTSPVAAAEPAPMRVQPSMRNIFHAPVADDDDSASGSASPVALGGGGGSRHLYATDSPFEPAAQGRAKGQRGVSVKWAEKRLKYQHIFCKNTPPRGSGYFDRAAALLQDALDDDAERRRNGGGAGGDGYGSGFGDGTWCLDPKSGIYAPRAQEGPNFRCGVQYGNGAVCCSVIDVVCVCALALLVHLFVCVRACNHCNVPRARTDPRWSTVWPAAKYWSPPVTPSA